jgi:hypothetical protein
MTDWNDKEQVIKAVSKDGMLLEYASDELKADREIVLAAVQNRSKGLQYVKYASEELRADPEIIRKVVLAALLEDLCEPSPELIDSNLRKNAPKEFQVLQDRWNEWLEKIVSFVCQLEVSEQTQCIESISFSVSSVAGVFQKACWCWEPVIEGSEYDEVDRLGQHFKGPMYTSEEYPWPADDEGCAYPPVFQIDLDEVSSIAGADIGDGFLQVFYNGEYDEHEPYQLSRWLPRESISEELMTPLPEDFDEFHTFKLDKEKYSYRNWHGLDESGCSVITGFEKGGFVVGYGECFAEIAGDLEPFATADTIDLVSDMGDELEKLEFDEGWGFVSTENIGGGLFGVYEPIQQCGFQMPDPFIQLNTVEMPNDGAGLFYIDDWYWDCS